MDYGSSSLKSADPNSDDEHSDYSEAVWRILLLHQMHVAQIMAEMIGAVSEAVSLACERQEAIPYHTSILTGEGWVKELIYGHPERIRTELGVHKDVFFILVAELRTAGFLDSRHVKIEEQLAMFLYTCVTGLSVRHVAERFQRANSTVSKYTLSFFSVNLADRLFS